MDKTPIVRPISLLLSLFLLSTACQPAAPPQDLPPPNILWLVSEDNAAEWLRLYHPDGGAPTPNIEWLAERGLTFDRAFSNAPVCSVARSTLISGCYAPRIGAQYHRRQQLVPPPEDLRLFPAYLRAAGYHTTNNAKEDYNLIKAEDVWDASGDEATYRDRTPGQPFFHVQNFHATHEGRLHFPTSDRQNKPLPAADSVTVFPYFPDTETFRYTHARYLEQHRRLDDQIGTFLDRLRADGLLDSTIIFYYGDHGGVLPRSKGYLYESGLRIPLVVYAPEAYAHLLPRPPGGRTQDFVSFVDFAPTVLNLAGVAVPEAMDGQPFLGGVAGRRDSIVFGYADRFDEKQDLVRSVRTGNLKYLRNYQPFNPDGLQNNYRYRMAAYAEWRELYRAGKLNEVQSAFFRARPAEQLFDLVRDPHETQNLAGDPRYASQLVRLRDTLNAWVRQLPDLSFFPEAYFLAEGSDNPVAFGRANAERIARLTTIADLQLSPYTEVRQTLRSALSDPDPWVRYWAAITATTHGGAARELEPILRQMAADDPELLVRLRAAEFLARTESTGADRLLAACLRDAARIEGIVGEATAGAVLNVLASLKDSDLLPGYDYPYQALPAAWRERERGNVARRLSQIYK